VTRLDVFESEDEGGSEMGGRGFEDLIDFMGVDDEEEEESEKIPESAEA
jgi:hypothetical protein